MFLKLFFLTPIDHCEYYSYHSDIILRTVIISKNDRSIMRYDIFIGQSYRKCLTC